MSENYKFIAMNKECIFVTMATVGWVDLFIRWELKQGIIEFAPVLPKRKRAGDTSLELMPSHLHMINKKGLRIFFSLHLLPIH